MFVFHIFVFPWSERFSFFVLFCFFFRSRLHSPWSPATCFRVFPSQRNRFLDLISICDLYLPPGSLECEGFTSAAAHPVGPSWLLTVRVSPRHPRTVKNLKRCDGSKRLWLTLRDPPRGCGRAAPPARAAQWASSGLGPWAPALQCVFAKTLR